MPTGAPTIVPKQKRPVQLCLDLPTFLLIAALLVLGNRCGAARGLAPIVLILFAFLFCGVRGL
jgi:hypothetical protein